MIKSHMVWSTYRTQGITEKYLFKFLSRENADKFFRSGGIWFSRADVFGDKMECVRIQDLKKGKTDFAELEARKRKFMISCWQLADIETIALWDIHADDSRERKNFAIRFKTNDLLALVRNYAIRNDLDIPSFQTELVHGRVAYKNLIGTTPEALSEMTVLRPAFRKEAAFSYEKEYRFVIRSQDEYSEKGFSYRLHDTQKLPFSIIVNPLLKDDKYLELHEYVISSGFKAKLRISKLAEWLKPDLW